MNTMRRVLYRSGLSAVLSVVAVSAFAAPTYRVEPLQQFSVDYPDASPVAINQGGIVVGSAYLPGSDSGDSKALLWNVAGQVSDLSAGAFAAGALDINRSGQIVLHRDGTHYISHQGTLTPLIANGIKINGDAINDAGQVAGWFTSGGQQHAVIYANGTATDLGTLPGGTFSYGYDINSSGQVVGTANNSSGQSRAVLWSNGAVVDLGTLPGHTISVASAINDAGQIVGYSGTGFPNYSTRAFLWENGVMTDIGNIGDNDYVTASDINNAGQIVGSARVNGQNRYTAFVWNNGTITNLNTVIGNTDFSGCYDLAINGAGQITGLCSNQSYRLTPAADAIDVGVDIATTPAYQVYQGSPLTYTIRVANTGSLPANSVNIADVLPAQMSLVSAVPSQGSCSGATTVTCALGNLAVGAMATVQVNVIPTTAGYNINNTVTVSAEGDSYAANNRSTATNTVREPLVLSDLAVSMTALQNPVPRRSNITYTVTVKNTGPNTAKEVVLSDGLPNNSVTLVSHSVSRGSCAYIANSLSCKLGDMANGETATLTLTVKPRYAFTFLKYTNTASVSSKTQDNNSANNYTSVTVSVK